VRGGGIGSEKWTNCCSGGEGGWGCLGFDWNHADNGERVKGARQLHGFEVREEKKRGSGGRLGRVVEEKEGGSRPWQHVEEKEGPWPRLASNSGGRQRPKAGGRGRCLDRGGGGRAADLWAPTTVLGFKPVQTK
jgi:hypothetical protein